MFDAGKILGSLLSSPTAKGFAGGMAGSMLLSKGGRKMGAKALKYGGIAAIGALAYRAYQGHQASKGAPASTGAGGAAASSDRSLDLAQLPPAGSGFLPAPTDRNAQQSLGLVLVRAMIAAAKADGRLDGQETAQILQGFDTHGLSDADRADLMNELAHPVDLEELVAAATTPPVAVEIYVAARTAIDPDTAAEKAWLQMLAARLGLEDGLPERVEQELALER
ncbi:Inner membrane protein YebE [Planctomycetes bacterium Pla163]|uniref:Inner membrane protein YebE n=1 Tax=Rohdeia mirabilis TaxID=2528008 RepID=A0A518CW79_9BACT|nr:Inner membrane protein YebE [Planctomycetes bacterium Pla163]